MSHTEYLIPTDNIIQLDTLICRRNRISLGSLNTIVITC